MVIQDLRSRISISVNIYCCLNRLLPVLHIYNSPMRKTILHASPELDRDRTAQRLYRNRGALPKLLFPLMFVTMFFISKTLFLTKKSRIGTPPRTKLEYEREILPRDIHAIPIKIMGGTQPISITVCVEDELGRPSYLERKVTFRSPSPRYSIYPVSSPTSTIGDIPIPEVGPSMKRVPPTCSRSSMPFLREVLM
ncbi:hypothetical protein EDD85DRAFT_356560 [Armillaria nabsnona]|nr:hypothetical protein EDD85DRAFT_356560 [Armillaria nabsnona]